MTTNALDDRDDRNGPSAAEASRDFFDLQLRFAEALAEKAALPLAHAITFSTNLHRRFAYGNVARQAPDPAFVAFAEAVAALPDRAARLDRAVTRFSERPVLGPPPGASEFGCFRCEPPDARGHVRIHFVNHDTTGGTSPLHRSKTEKRRAELAAMVAFLSRIDPPVTTLNGGSWLYNLDAYRRLFPPEFVASRTPLAALHGGSIWGQFLDFRGAVKPAVRDAFLARLGTLDPQCPWSIFPLPVLKTSASLETFRREYGV